MSGSQSIWLFATAGEFVKVAGNASKGEKGTRAVQDMLPICTLLPMLIIQHSVKACLSACTGAWGATKLPGVSKELAALIIQGRDDEEEAMVRTAITIASSQQTSSEAYTHMKKSDRIEVARKTKDLFDLLRALHVVFTSQSHRSLIASF